MSVKPVRYLRLSKSLELVSNGVKPALLEMFIFTRLDNPPCRPEILSPDLSYLLDTRIIIIPLIIKRLT